MRTAAILLFALTMIEGAFDKLYDEMIKGADEDEDEEEIGFMTLAGIRAVDNVIQTIPLVRNVVDLESQITGGWSNAELSPIARPIADADRMIRKLVSLPADIEDGEPIELTASERKLVIRLISVFGKVPFSAPYNMVDDLMVKEGVWER